MHSEQTELHLQHMIERAQMGMQGEENCFLMRSIR